MAGVGWTLTTPGAVALSAGTPRTVMQMIAPAQQRILLEDIIVGFDGVTNTAVPVLIEVVTQTTAGTMTSLTPIKTNPSDSETLQMTAAHSATVEPTSTANRFETTVHPQSPNCLIPKPSRTGCYPIPGGTRLGVRMTASASVNVVVTACGSE